MQDEKKVEEISGEVPMIDQVVAKIKEENVLVNDLMFSTW